MQPRPLAILAVIALVLLPHVTATPSPPRNLSGSYAVSTGLVSLSWQPPEFGTAGFTYLVWRDGNVSLGQTSGLSAMDDPPGLVPDYGLIYLVSAAPPGQPDNIGLPALVAIPTIECEVVSITTSWSSPYLAIHLHEECLGGTIIYDKYATWEQP